MASPRGESSAGHTRLDQRRRLLGTATGHLHVRVKGQCHAHSPFDKALRFAEQANVSVGHGERFGHILPANTLVEARLVGAEYLVEIEADAIVSES